MPFAEVLQTPDLQQILDAEDVSFGATPKAYWNPALTLWTFLCQLLDPDKSCRRAVARAILAFSLTTTPEELDTARYCRARAKIPAQVLQQLSLHVAQHLKDAAPTDWRWHGRRVHLVDGSTSRLPDTAANQAAFPQPTPQKPGLGFPLIRWVVLASLATAVVQEGKRLPCEVGSCFGLSRSLFALPALSCALPLAGATMENTEKAAVSGELGDPTFLPQKPQLPRFPRLDPVARPTGQQPAKVP